MQEREGLVTFQGNPLVLLGNPVSVGDTAPDFTVVSNDLAPKTLADYPNTPLILASVPSLDTSVCSLETKRFNQEAKNLAGPVTVLTISMDLPFAQARWVQEHDADKVTTLSDHAQASFGEAYGVLIKDLRLLARAIFVVNRDRKVTYTEIVPEMTNEPNYDQVIEEAKKLA